MSISDIFKPTSGGAGGFCAAGRIETGYIQKSDTVLIAPLNEYAAVKVNNPYTSFLESRENSNVSPSLK